ncbi:MAG: hypothetical protein HQK51_18750 [Oligoflexia bacterium]|nr:hypothetical protein [Oligoflexia bacterium]
MNKINLTLKIFIFICFILFFISYICISNYSLAQDSSTPTYTYYSNIIKSIADKEKLTNQIIKLSLEDAHAISNLQRTERNILCSEMGAELPNFMKILPQLPAMSIKTNIILVRIISLYTEACSSSPEQLYKILWEINIVSSNLIRNLFQKPIVFFLPQEATGLLFKANNINSNNKILKLDTLFSWLSNDLSLAIYNQSCNEQELKLNRFDVPLTLPNNSVCLAPWLMSNILQWAEQNKLLENSNNFLTNFKNSVDSFIKENSNQIPANWYSFLSWPYKKLPTSSNLDLLRSFYQSKDYNGILNFFAKNSSQFSTMLNISSDILLPIIGPELIAKAKEQTIYLLQSLPNSYDSQIDPMFLATIGKYLYLPLLFEYNHYNKGSISSYDFFNNVRNILNKTTQGFKIHSPLATLLATHTDLLNIQISLADFDVITRDNLGLMFSIGGSHDLEDIKNNFTFSANFNHLAIDHIIGNYLRKIDNSPWVNIEEAIEELDNRQEVTQLIINKLAKNRLMQMFYLDQFDMESDDLLLINEIRDLAFKIEILRFDFQPIRLMVHNGFNESIIGIIDNFFFNLNPSEQQSIGGYYNQLTNKLKKFFSSTANPELLMEKDLNKIKDSLPILALELTEKFYLLKKLSLTTSNATSASVVTSGTIANQKLKILYEISSKLMEKITAIETNDTDTSNPSAVTNLKDKDASYFHLLRLFKITHTLIIRYLPEIKFESKEIFLKENHSYIKHLFEYTGININSNNNYININSDINLCDNLIKNFEFLTKINNSIADKIRDDFYPRLALFHIFSNSQVSRYSTNTEYNFTMNTRQEALPLLVENLIRTHGLGLIYLFDPTSFDQSITPEKKVMNEGESYGLLKFVAQAEINRYPYRFDEVIITDTLPSNLGVTAALITTVYQPLSSHVDLRTKERNTPNAFIKNAHITSTTSITSRVKPRSVWNNNKFVTLGASARVSNGFFSFSNGDVKGGVHSRFTKRHSTKFFLRIITMNKNCHFHI